MKDLARIQQVIRQARRRIRAQAALEAATTSGIVAVAGALVVFWLWRMEIITGLGALVTCGLLLLGVGVAGLLASLQRLPDVLVARRLDRASGLADRLGTAIDFHNRLRDLKANEHPDTIELMRRAIDDGIKSVPRVDIKRSAPFRRPTDLLPLGAFVFIGALVTLLSFHPALRAGAALVDATGRNGLGNPADDPENKGIDLDDLEFSKQFVEDMKQMAEQTGDKYLHEFADKLDDLMQKAERGELSKEEMMAQMEQLEKDYMKGADEQNLDDILDALKEMAKQLAQDKDTQALADALEKGDMQQAAQELEKLAEKMEKGDMPPEQQKKLADALDKAADKAEQKQKEQDQKKDEQANKDQQKKEEEIRKLQKKLEKEPNNEEAKRQLQKKQRELDELKREQQEKKEQAHKRSLDRLQRNMKQSAEALKNKKQQESAQNMKNAADESRKIEDEVKKISNQKRVQSQLNDLKEAIRRAKPRKGGGKGQGMASRIKDYNRRAGGQQGDRQAWRSGQKGNGHDDPNGQPGNGYGDSHDENLMGDPTKLNAHKKDEDVQGVQGQGMSRRETILTAAKKGFATQAYRKVYADYKKVVEEVMASEKVPQGYKYYVKRYFQRIKPHSMD